MTVQPAPGQNPYENDTARYLQKIARLFGGYKKRSFAFLDVQPGHAALEVGCGTGEDAVALAAMVGPSGHVVGVDTNASLLSAARAKTAGAANIRFLEADVTALPLESDSFDRARADRLFQHLPDPGQALGEMIRVTRTGGWISVLDIDWASLLVDSSFPAVTRIMQEYLARQGVNGSAGVQLHRLFKRSGLTQVEVYAETVCINDVPVANMIWNLEPYARKAAAEGILPAPAAEEWIAELQARDGAGEFFASMTGFVARGQKK